MSRLEIVSQQSKNCNLEEPYKNLKEELSGSPGLCPVDMSRAS